MTAAFWTHYQSRVVCIWWVSPSQKGDAESNINKEHDSVGAQEGQNLLEEWSYPATALIASWPEDILVTRVFQIWRPCVWFHSQEHKDPNSRFRERVQMIFLKVDKKLEFDFIYKHIKLKVEMSFGWKYWYIKFTVKATYLKFYFTKKKGKKRKL